MESALEIYRPILDSGADDLADCAVRVSETLGLGDGCSYLKWGESPKVGLVIITGEVGLELYEQSFDLLFDATKADMNRKDFKLRNLIAWGWDLGKVGNDVNGINPRIEVAENRFLREQPKAGNRLLWRRLSKLTILGARAERIDASVMSSIRNQTMRNIALIGLSDTSRALSLEEFKAKRRDLAALIPKVKLGPMQIRYGETNPEDYGYLSFG